MIAERTGERKFKMLKGNGQSIRDIKRREYNSIQIRSGTHASGARSTELDVKKTSNSVNSEANAGHPSHQIQDMTIRYRAHLQIAKHVDPRGIYQIIERKKTRLNPSHAWGMYMSEIRKPPVSQFELHQIIAISPDPNNNPSKRHPPENRREQSMKEKERHSVGTSSNYQKEKKEDNPVRSGNARAETRNDKIINARQRKD